MNKWKIIGIVLAVVGAFVLLGSSPYTSAERFESGIGAAQIAALVVAVILMVGGITLAVLAHKKAKAKPTEEAKEEKEEETEEAE